MLELKLFLIKNPFQIFQTGLVMFQLHRQINVVKIMNFKLTFEGDWKRNMSLWMFH